MFVIHHNNQTNLSVDARYKKPVERTCMRIILLQTGKTRDPFIVDGMAGFSKRMERYAPFRIETVPDLKNSGNLTMKEVQEKEGEQIIRKIRNGDYVILLDERGKTFDSIGFARHLNKLEGSVNQLVFVIGGPFGFSARIYERANELFSLSRLTFSHQLVRLVFMEQLYRAYTILNGEAYHHA
jgi:23S rRNA (pseudouridine1915-N3)-methyltransferase